jgi:hypothetical protein
MQYSDPFDSLLFWINAAHFVAISFCVLASAYYIKRTGFFADILRWWAIALLFVLFLNFYRNYSPFHFGNAWDVVIGAMLSNSANLAVLQMTRRVWRQSNRHGEFSPVLWSIVALVYIGPILTHLVMLSLTGDADPVSQSATWNAAIRLPNVLFSATVLFLAGHAFRNYLIAVKNVIYFAFFVYAVYQFPYAVLIFLDWDPNNLIVAQTIYTQGLMMLKVVCTATVIVAASEYGRRAELIAINRRLARTADTWVEAATFSTQVQVLCSLEGDDCDFIAEELRKRDLSPEVLSEHDLPRLSTNEILSRLLRSKYCIAIFGSEIPTAMVPILETFLSQRKSCLMLSRVEERVTTSLEFEQQSPITLYSSPGELKLELRRWMGDNLPLSLFERHGRENPANSTSSQ